MQQEIIFEGMVMGVHRMNLFPIIGIASCIFLLFSSCMSKKSPSNDYVGVFPVRYIFEAAKNVYIGKLLSAERIDEIVPDDSLGRLRIKVDVKEVLKVNSNRRKLSRMHLLERASCMAMGGMY